MEKNKKVSIIVPCYNGEKYISRSLDGLLKQTYKNFEVIVVNDGSKDNSKKIAEEYVKKYSQIKLVNQSNGGIWKARLAGLNNSTGYYIGFIDVDDDIHEDFIEKLVNSMVENDSDIAVCGYERIDNETKKVLCEEMTKWKYPVYDIKDNINIIPSINTSNWNKLYKKELFRDFDDIELKSKTFEDMALNIIAYINADKISFINEPLYYYYVNSTSLMNNLKEEDVDAFNYTMKSIRDYVERSDPRFLEAIDIMAMIHLEFSIVQRVYFSPLKNKKALANKTRNYILENFPLIKKSKYVKLSYQGKKKFYNIKISILYYVFKFNLVNMFIKTYIFVITKLKIDIKW